MVRTVPAGDGPGLVEVGPDACPDCGGKPMRPKFDGCKSPTERGHRAWWCTACGLWLIDADCNCDTPGRRWPS